MRVPAYSNLMKRGFTAEGDCILSNATPMPNGYRVLAWQGKTLRAHRVSYEEWHGPIPVGAHVDHTCHNEAAHAGQCAGGSTCIHRSCVNPLHLRAVTAGENIGASPFSAKGRGPLGAAKTQADKTHCKQGHEFNEANTYLFHNKKTGWSTRQCKVCRRINGDRLRATRVENGLTVHGIPRQVPFVKKPRKNKVG